MVHDTVGFCARSRRGESEERYRKVANNTKYVVVVAEDVIRRRQPQLVDRFAKDERHRAGRIGTNGKETRDSVST